jgi:hypothetical protein
MNSAPVKKHERKQRPDMRCAHALGALAAGLLVAGLSQTALAPSAHADDPITDILTDISGSINAGETELISAAFDFSNSDVPDGMATGLAGLDNLLVAPEEDLWVNVTDALLGDPEVGGFDFGSFPPPVDLADTLSDVQGAFQSGAQDFGLAANALLSGDLAVGVLAGTEAADSFFMVVPEVSFVGLTDTLLGL